MAAPSSQPSLSFNFLNIFAYIELAAGIVGAAMAILHLVQSPEPLVGAQLLAVVSPVLAAVQMLVPKANIPADLALDVCNTVADTVNRYFKKA